MSYFLFFFYKHIHLQRFKIYHHLFQTLTDVVAFDGAEHAEGLNQPAAVLHQAVQVGTRTELIKKDTRMAEKGYNCCVLMCVLNDLNLFLDCVVTHRQQILHGNHKAGVSDEPVPQSQDVFDRLH